MTALGSRMGSEETTPSASAATTKVAGHRRSRISVSRLASAAAANARPAAAASISLGATSVIPPSVAALGARVSSHTGITGSLRRAAGLSR